MTNLLTKTVTMIEVPESLLYAVVGFSVVFIGIALLIAVVWAVGKIMAYLNPGSAPKKPAPVAQSNAVAAPSVKADEVDEETLAVITAALMAYYQTNKPKCEFTVKRIKRI